MGFDAFTFYNLKAQSFFNITFLVAAFYVRYVIQVRQFFFPQVHSITCVLLGNPMFSTPILVGLNFG